MARPVALPNVRLSDPRSSTTVTDCATMHDWWFDHIRPICAATAYDLQSQVRSIEQMIDLVATNCVLPITHDFCDQSCVRSTIFPRFQHFSVAPRSQSDRMPGVTGALKRRNYPGDDVIQHANPVIRCAKTMGHHHALHTPDNANTMGHHRPPPQPGTTHVSQSQSRYRD